MAQATAPTLPQPLVTPSRPLVQDFENGTANFGRSEDQGVGDLGDDVFTAPGGVGGSQQLQTVSTLATTGAFQDVLFRAEAILGASTLAFTGDWLAAGADTFSLTVQHDAPIDLQYGLRFATRNFAFDSDNFPGVFPVGIPAVAPNTLTEIRVAIDPAFFVAEAPMFGGFSNVFSDITNIQVSVGLPSGFGEVSQELLNVAAFDPSITAPAGFGAGDIINDFTILEDVPIVDENNQPVLIQAGPAAGQQVVQDLVLPNAGAQVFLNSADPIVFGLDNVTLTAVPEPMAGVLIATASLVGALHRRHARR